MKQTFHWFIMGARLTGEDIWITHTAIIKQLAASTTGSEGDNKVNLCQHECLRDALSCASRLQLLSCCNVANCVKIDVSITVKVNLETGETRLSPCQLPWRRDSQIGGWSRSPCERTGSDTISKYISFPLVVCFTSVLCHMGLKH